MSTSKSQAELSALAKTPFSHSLLAFFHQHKCTKQYALSSLLLLCLEREKMLIESRLHDGWYVERKTIFHCVSAPQTNHNG